MFKRIKFFICSIFNIKACQCDEHITMYTEVPEPDVPVHEPCPRHRYHKNKCPMCQAALTQRKNMPGMEKKGRSMIANYKKGGKAKKKSKFPDHSGDGKITKKDILMAKGIIPKKKKKKGKA